MIYIYIKIRIFEFKDEKMTNILGFIIGHHEYIHCIQCYYEKKNQS